ncbi:hypothetical protein [Runella sp.]|uniref:hypothetical protein n=1 Tax=Runella sp. TaxID=1960881 RepID=UPI002620AE70|nr:hypothetical protein [Runella sp.]
MKQEKTFKIIAVISYLLIILMGDMIGLPFFIWLLFTLVDFGNTDQLFAFLSVIGLTIIFMKLNSTRTLQIVLIDIVCFLLLAAPIVRRLTLVPIEKFNYLAFIIPMVIFVLLYSMSIYFSIKQYLQIQKVAVLRKG